MFRKNKKSNKEKAEIFRNFKNEEIKNEMIMDRLNREYDLRKGFIDFIKLLQEVVWTGNEKIIDVFEKNNLLMAISIDESKSSFSGQDVDLNLYTVKYREKKKIGKINFTLKYYNDFSKSNEFEKAELTLLQIDYEFERKGLGTKLLSLAERELKKKGIKKICGVMYPKEDELHKGAYQFYLSNNFDVSESSFKKELK